MDHEEERLLRLIRSGRETIIKYGTYDLVKARNIIQDHPFYVQPSTLNCFDEEPEAVQAAEPELSAEELAAQITSSNFKVGMSQEEVDAFLASMSF